MPTFAELVDNVVHLSTEEMEEMRRILNRKLAEKKRQELYEASEEAMKEYKEGKSITLNTPEEIRKYFTDIMNEKD